MDADIALGCDHGGFLLARAVAARLRELGKTVLDVGTDSEASVDYPDFAAKVAAAVAAGRARQGILVCGTGIGMSIAANKAAGVRAAVCTSQFEAYLARAHNDANVLCLGGRVTAAPHANAIVETFLSSAFEGGRHARRVAKVAASEGRGRASALAAVDPEIWRAIREETARQAGGLELIASENFVSPAVLEALGSPLTNKYAEGYPGRRYYGGCQWVDVAEQLAIDRAKKLFGAEAANVQPHSGSQANMAAYFALAKPGDTLLALDLAQGGHLTHGAAVNFSGKLFRVVHYGVRRDTETIDYDEVARLAREHRPRIVVAGFSAYPRTLDFAAFRAAADSVGAALVVDIAHIAGLVAAGLSPSPVPFAEIVTTTTHKTLRGPRGGLILCREPIARTLNSQIFPGIQGGPLMHVIAAKAVAFAEALQPGFAAYQRRVLENAQALGRALSAGGLRLVSGGTDNHLLLVDVRSVGLTGKAAEEALGLADVTVNKNMIPFDPEKPMVTSGIRVGTPALTTRGMGPSEMEQIGALLSRVLRSPGDEGVRKAAKAEVAEIAGRFPLYADRLGD